MLVMGGVGGGAFSTTMAGAGATSSAGALMANEGAARRAGACSPVSAAFATAAAVLLASLLAAFLATLLTCFTSLALRPLGTTTNWRTGLTAAGWGKLIACVCFLAAAVFLATGTMPALLAARAPAGNALAELTADAVVDAGPSPRARDARASARRASRDKDDGDAALAYALAGWWPTALAWAGRGGRMVLNGVGVGVGVDDGDWRLADVRGAGVGTASGLGSAAAEAAAAFAWRTAPITARTAAGVTPSRRFAAACERAERTG